MREAFNSSISITRKIDCNYFIFAVFSIDFDIRESPFSELIFLFLIKCFFTMDAFPTFTFIKIIYIHLFIFFFRASFTLHIDLLAFITIIITFTAIIKTIIVITTANMTTTDIIVTIVIMDSFFIKGEDLIMHLYSLINCSKACSNKYFKD